MVMKKYYVCIFLAAFILIAFTGCVKSIKYQYVDASVISRTYTPERAETVWYYNASLRQTLPTTEITPESYETVIGYSGVTTTDYDKSAYQSTHIGQTIKMRLITYLGDNNQILKQELNFAK